MRLNNALSCVLTLAAAACSREASKSPGAGSAEVAVAAPITAATPAKTGTGPVWIETECDEDAPATKIAEIKQDHPAARDVELGKAAIVVEDGGSQDLTAWDTDSSCRVNIHAPKDADVIGLAQTILDQLPPRS